MNKNILRVIKNTDEWEDMSISLEHNEGHWCILIGSKLNINHENCLVNDVYGELNKREIVAIAELMDILVSEEN